MLRGQICVTVFSLSLTLRVSSKSGLNRFAAFKTGRLGIYTNTISREKKIVFGHISTVAFLILGFAFVRIMTSFTSLIAINKSDSKEKVTFYWPHTLFCFITVFTMILFWWTATPLQDVNFYPDENWNLFTYILFLAVPMLMFLIAEVVIPYDHDNKSVDLREHYYKYHMAILGLAWVLQVFLLANFFAFYNESDIISAKVIGRCVMLGIMLPMVCYPNKRIHEVGMTIFFLGFIYTILKYHVFVHLA